MCLFTAPPDHTNRPEPFGSGRHLLYLVLQSAFERIILFIQALNLILQGIVLPGGFRCLFRVFPDLRISQRRFHLPGILFLIATPCSVARFVKVQEASGSDILGLLAAVGLYVLVGAFVAFVFGKKK